MTLATGVGSMPGTDAEAYAEAVRIVLGELPDLPHLPELPGRGVWAGMTGRALGLVDGLGADLQPSGWRLTDSVGVDQRRARSLVAQDLDQVEQHAQGLTGAFKVQVAGPWTLAATVEKPRGDKVLSDHGARRELAQALAEGVRLHVADVRRRLGGGVDRIVVQVDEPVLSAVLGGRVPTASGFSRHRSVDFPEASAALAWVLDAAADAGAEPWVHSCAPAPLDLLRGSGARGLSVDLDVMSAADLDVLAEALEAGETVVVGAVPGADPHPAPTEAQVTDRVLRLLDMLGLDPQAVGARLGVSPSCGLAGASPDWSLRALTILRTAAAHLS